MPERLSAGSAWKTDGRAPYNHDRRLERAAGMIETLPEFLPSIRVLQKNRFKWIGEGSEPGGIRFVPGRS